MSDRSVVPVLVAVALLAIAGAGFGVAAAVPGGDTGVADSSEIELSDRGLQVSQSGETAKVDPTLYDDTGETTVILSVDRGVELSGATNVGPLLQANSDATLGPVANEVESLSAATVQNRITLGNLLVVDINLDVHSVDTLARIDGVERVVPNVRFTVPEPDSQLTAADGEVGATGGDVSPASEHGFTYGLQQIDIPGFEEEFNGERGGDATVAIVDNGFSNPEEGHPDIDVAKKYLVVNGNVTEGVLLPGSHGEHVAGTATGAANPVGDVPRYGVAPEAKLIKLDVFGDTPGASFVDIGIALNISAFDENADVAGFSLGADPTDPNAEARYNPIFSSIVADANNVGMAASISSGNAGLGAVGSPGSDFLAMSVAASNSAGGIAGFSSGGVISNDSIQQFAGEPEPRVLPGYFPRKYVKPDVAAPGVNVLSAGPLGTPVNDPNATYSLSQGTSMAQPHVAGAIALLQSLTAEQLPPEQIQTALAETAEKPNLEGVRELNGRDTRYGAGIINVTAAGLALQDTQTIEGTVTGADGESLVGATVETDAAGLTTARGSDGSYTLSTTQTPANVTADAFGYASETVQVSGGTTTDFTLDPVLALELDAGQPGFAEINSSFTLARVDVANLEEVTVNLTANSTVDPADLTLFANGNEIPLGQTVPFDPAIDGEVTLTAEVAPGVANGSVFGLEHTFGGVGDQTTVETGPTTVVDELQPAEFQVTSISGPETAIGYDDPIPMQATIKNVGQVGGAIQGEFLAAGPGDTDATLGPSSFEVGPKGTVTATQNFLSVEVINGALGFGWRPGDDFQVVFRVGENLGSENEVVVDNATTPFDVDDYFLEVSNLSAPAAAVTGSTVDVSADVTNVGTQADTQNVTFAFGGAAAAVNSVDLGAGDSTGVTFSGVPLPQVPGFYTHGVVTNRSSQFAPITVSPDLNGNGAPARDTTGDGNLNDVDGDGDTDIVDVQALFDSLDRGDVQSNPGLFDFAGLADDRVSVFDVQALFTQTQAQT